MKIQGKIISQSIYTIYSSHLHKCSEQTLNSNRQECIVYN